MECRFSYECPTYFEPIAACIDWDPELRLLALGTKGGALRVFGAPGVELLGQHEGEELTVLRFILRHSYSKQLLDSIRLDCLRLSSGFCLSLDKADWSHSHLITAYICGR